MPPVRSRIARFANEVVLGEESDPGLDGKPVSHFESCLRAMDEVGADSAPVRRFTTRQGGPADPANRNDKMASGPLALSSLLVPTVGATGHSNFRTEPTSACTISCEKNSLS
jgi:Protein of unknown function (DUF3050)